MGNGPPKTLSGIQFLGHEIRDCNFTVHVDPTGKQSGYLNQNINFDFEYNQNKTFSVYTALEMNAFVGDAENRTPDDEKVFTLKLNIVLNYSTKNANSSVSQIKRYEWHFKSQAMILLHNVSRDIMKDTRFRVLDNTLSLPL